MIDPTIRKMRIIEEAKDPGTAVILMDFVLGYGSHNDPAGALVDSIREAQELARSEGREIIFMGHVCGTRKDPQNFVAQEKKLKKAGVIVFPTNALMVVASALTVTRGKIKREKLRKVYRNFLLI